MNVYDDDTLGQFVASEPDPLLLNIVQRLVERTKTQGLWDSTCIVVGEPTAELLGFNPLSDPPDWAWRHEHGDWVEMGLILDDFSWIILVSFDSPLAARE